jgi:hypothetical protein
MRNVRILIDLLRVEDEFLIDVNETFVPNFRNFLREQPQSIDIHAYAHISGLAIV